MQTNNFALILLYIYVYIYRERETHTHTYIYIDLATSSDCYKCGLTSVLAAIYSWSSSYENRSETGLIRLQVSDLSFKSYTGY